MGDSKYNYRHILFFNNCNIPANEFIYGFSWSIMCVIFPWNLYCHNNSDNEEENNMKPTEQWIKIATIVGRVIFTIPYFGIVSVLLIIGCLAWFLSLGHLGHNAFIPAFFIADLFNYIFGEV